MKVIVASYGDGNRALAALESLLSGELAAGDPVEAGI